MNIAEELAELFSRDLSRLIQELDAFTDEDKLWRTMPGVSNSAGNLALHLEGNLREYIGCQLGNIQYDRNRTLEFNLRDLPAADLIQRIGGIQELIPRIVSGLSRVDLESIYPEKVFSAQLSTQQFLISLQGHLNFHLGQIDYLRRILTHGPTIKFAGL